ncbi:hypothetical protein HELRODRAFT_171302 [Helobdella robusta]|uniref:Uncharacterized protein n=1 Tax=Helobdella robusta TaxID=6412 RepID=T1F423_HELRO|nr:hypothetical protein HELRODRAFT_171302 [Helobdella robusta]ESO05644.1 hypothetical protein HELRODRAFT_171302 [Helobdella robusta]
MNSTNSYNFTTIPASNNTLSTNKSYAINSALQPTKQQPQLQLQQHQEQPQVWHTNLDSTTISLFVVSVVAPALLLTAVFIAIKLKNNKKMKRLRRECVTNLTSQTSGETIQAWRSRNVNGDDEDEGEDGHHGDRAYGKNEPTTIATIYSSDNYKTDECQTFINHQHPILHSNFTLSEDLNANKRGSPLCPRTDLNDTIRAFFDHHNYRHFKHIYHHYSLDNEDLHNSSQQQTEREQRTLNQQANIPQQRISSVSFDRGVRCTNRPGNKYFNHVQSNQRFSGTSQDGNHFNEDTSNGPNIRYNDHISTGKNNVENLKPSNNNNNILDANESKCHYNNLDENAEQNNMDCIDFKNNKLIGNVNKSHQNINTSNNNNGNSNNYTTEKCINNNSNTAAQCVNNNILQTLTKHQSSFEKIRLESHGKNNNVGKNGSLKKDTDDETVDLNYNSCSGIYERINDTMSSDINAGQSANFDSICDVVINSMLPATSHTLSYKCHEVSSSCRAECKIVDNNFNRNKKFVSHLGDNNNNQINVENSNQNVHDINYDVIEIADEIKCANKISDGTTRKAPNNSNFHKNNSNMFDCKVNRDIVSNDKSFHKIDELTNEKLNKHKSINNNNNDANYNATSLNDTMHINTNVQQRINILNDHINNNLTNNTHLTKLNNDAIITANHHNQVFNKTQRHDNNVGNQNPWKCTTIGYTNNDNPTVSTERTNEKSQSINQSTKSNAYAFVGSTKLNVDPTKLNVDSPKLNADSPKLNVDPTKLNVDLTNVNADSTPLNTSIGEYSEEEEVMKDFDAILSIYCDEDDFLCTSYEFDDNVLEIRI